MNELEHNLPVGSSLGQVSSRFTGEAPLEKWHPPYCGEMDLRIDARGDWYHEGRLMIRQALVDLFARVLWRETVDGQDRYFLKTPVEKIGIQVEDVPLLAIGVEQRVDAEGQAWLWLHTRTGDQVRVDAEHPLCLREYQHEWRPYVRVRRNLEALLHRNVLFHLVELGELVDQDGETLLRVHSGDQVYELGGLGAAP